MERALIEMAKQIAKLQEENDNLKLQLKKNKRKKVKTLSPEEERHERVTRWVSVQYQRGFNAALKKESTRKRLAQIRKHDPVYMPINDCMDSWPSGNK